jgi:CBS-domain-containing membrane protein
MVIDDDGRPVGIVTDGDLIRREEFGGAPDSTLWRTLFSDDRTLARAFAKAYGRHVHSVMTTELETTSDDTPLADAAQRLFTRNIRALPVLQDGRAVGLLTRSDIVRTLGRMGAETPVQHGGDEQMRDELARRISRAGWVSPQQLTFSVAEGRVELEGTLSSHDQRAALIALAEGIPGVRTVTDRLRVVGGLVAAAA